MAKLELAVAYQPVRLCRTLSRRGSSHKLLILLLNITAGEALADQVELIQRAIADRDCA